MRVVLGGYQGALSVHTRALRELAAGLKAGGYATEVRADATAGGGTARSLFDAAEAGTGPQLCYLASGYLTARVPALDLLDLPFRVADRGRALAALDGAVGEALAGEVARRTGFRVLAFWDNGFRHLSNRARPIRTPADGAGLVVRTLDSRIYQDALRAMGFTPVVTDVRDLREALASGRVDAQENPLTNLLLFELWRYHPYVSLTGHLFGIALLVANAAWFDRLAPAGAAALRSAVARATRVQREMAAAEDAVALASLESLGVAVLRADEVDRTAFNKSCAALVAHEAERFDPALLKAFGG